MLENIRIVLVHTSHPGNIGAAARAMKNMGLDKLTLVQPKQHPSLEAYSRAAGADDVLANAVVVDSLAEAIADCVWVAGTSARSRTVKWQVFEPRECATQCLQHSSEGEVAIVFGRESSGLTNEELEQCHALVHIPANPDYSSLNVAAAVQILSYECRLAALASGALAAAPASQGSKHRDDVPASVAQLDDMYRHLHETLEHIDFFGTNNPEIVMRRLRGLFNRARISRREVAILRGIFSAAQKSR